MIRTFTVSMLLVATACSSPPTYTVTAPPAGDPDTVRSGCGVERWPVKTGSDPDVARIKPTPVPTTIAALTSIPAPRVLPPNHRISPVETTTYTLHAVLTGFKLESDGDFHLVVSDGGKTMIVELASPTCVTPDPLKTQITTARKQFNAWYQPGPQFQHVNVPVTVTGVGFFDSLHGQTGVAPNGIELHPILNITFDRAK